MRAGRTVYANKLWGRGRLAQLRRRTRCRILGHRWSPPWEGVRNCMHRCGGVRFEPRATKETT